MSNKDKLNTIQKMFNLLEQLENKEDKTQKEIDLEHICYTFFDSITQFINVFNEGQNEIGEWDLTKFCPKPKSQTYVKSNVTVFKVAPHPYVSKSSLDTNTDYTGSGNKQAMFDEAMAFGAGICAGGIASFVPPDTNLEAQQLSEFNNIMKNMDFTNK